MKRTAAVAGLLVVFALGLFCITGTSHADQKQVTLKVAHFFPPTSAQGQLFEQWAKDVEKKTNGKVKVTVFSGATLAPAPQIYDATVKGIADVGNHVLGYTVGRFPFLEGIDLPHGYPSGSVATKMTNAFYKKFQPKEVEAVKILWFHAQAPGIVHTKSKPVNKLEDLKGLRMRTFGTNAKFMSNLGGTPVAMPMTDVYDSLSKGVVEGFLGSYETMHVWAFADFIRYSTENYWSSYTAVFMVCMNKNKWNGLPKDVQAAIDQLSVEYIDKFAKMWDDEAKTGKDALIKKGGKIITLPKEEQLKFAEKAKPLIDEYAANMKTKGLPGDEAVKFIQDYLKPYKQ